MYLFYRARVDVKQIRKCALLSQISL